MSDSASQSSFSTGADSSVASSADARQLNDLTDRGANDDGIASDLVEQNRTFEDAVFASLFTLSKNRKTTDLRWTAARVVLEFLQMFRVVFNTVLTWKIDTDVWIWKAFYWLLFRLVVARQGYDTYIAVFYVIASIILACLVLTVWVAVILKKDETGNVWLRRLVAVLQLMGLVLFTVFWVAVLDYMVFLFSCKWSDIGQTRRAPHIYFEDKNCLAMPHLAHMCFALVMSLLFCFATLCMSVSDCDLNPLSRSHLASPLAVTGLKTIALKMAMVIVSTCLQELGKTQSVLMLVCAVCVTYFILKTVPYYYDAANCAWVGLWAGIVFTCSMLVALDYTLGKFVAPLAALMHREAMTSAVLYGIFPAVLLGAGCCWLYLGWCRRPLTKLREAAAHGETGLVLKDVYRFTDPADAEVLLRAMRKWDLDGVPDPDTTAFGEFIIKCAIARLPNSPFILTVYSNFIIEVRKDGQAARTQLQLAAKNSPGLLDRYFIYVSQEVAKKLKSESEGLDLLGYVEFQRSYRACVRAHKMALQAQRQFWHSMLRDSVAFRDLQTCFELMDRTEKQATAVYRRVMERYPTNGKLLKVYGRFLEYVRNDPWNASKYYAEAMKQGTTESLMALTVSSNDGGGTDTGSRITALMGTVDEKNDGIVIINAAGIIMMINGAGARVFGYEKGELDGKNVSTLMPLPFSTRHNSYLQRYLTTGHSTMLNNLRQVVGLHKDRTVFPVGVVVTKLSGNGNESIFLGVLRAVAADDTNTVKAWCTTTGMVMCVDDRFRDCFGISSKELVGRSLSSVSTEQEAFDKWVAACVAAPAEVVSSSTFRLQTKIQHKYLSPIDCEVTCEFGGSGEQRLLLLELRLMADSLALMVTDAKGRIQFATSQLADMLGYSVKVMTDGMNMTGLLPPPYSQLHPGYMKDISGKPPPGSCRAGAVVHLMHANNTKLPVTLNISQRDDGDHLQHVIKVLPASEVQLLDQQRLELTLNHKGVVLSVNEGAPKSVFGFFPAALVGRPLASFVNVFREWQGKFGEDDSLLVMLGLRAQQSHDVIFRVGIHNPLSDTELQQAVAKARSGAAGAAAEGPSGQERSSLLGALTSHHTERPAIMTLAVVRQSEEEELATAEALEAEADSRPLLTMCLWRSEGLTSQLEVDGRLGITRADPAAGLMLGVSHHALLRKSFKALAHLPADTSGADLLSSSGKKSMLKEGAAWKMGPPRTLDAQHADEAGVKIQMQAVSKDGKSSSKLVLMLRLLDNSMGSIAPLLALRTAALTSDEGAANKLQRADSGEDEAAGAPGDDDNGAAAHEADDGSDGGSGGGGGGGKRPGSPDLHDRLNSRLRVSEWVASSFRKGGPEDGDGSPRGKSKLAQASGRRSAQPQQPAAAARFADPRDAANSGGGHGVVEVRTGRAGKPMKGGEDDDGDGGGSEASKAGGGSEASGSQSAGDGASEGQDAASTAASGEDELMADWRRAKRLKKLSRMLTSTAAQVAAERFRRHTYLLTLIIMVAHIVCFVVLLTQVNARYETAFEVGDMAQAIERSQMSAMRINFIQKCGSPAYDKMLVCHQDHIDDYIKKMRDNYSHLRRIHQGLYLGYTKLKKFSDVRLLNRWTYTPQPELVWFAELGNATAVVVPENTTLWEMGNRYLQCMQDVVYFAQQLRYHLAETSYWNYISDNGPAGMFDGYSWSLDVFVDYAWNQLGALNNVLVVLLIVEALLVQITTMTYEFVLLKAANVEAMKRFSVFLALPSATIRAMASRQMQVDDDDKSDIDDDELEAINNAGQATEAEQQAEKAAGDEKGAKNKSVRMSVAGGGDDDAPSTKKKNAAAKSKSGSGAAAAHKPKTFWQLLDKKLFGWSRTTFKINGKKLVPHNNMIWRFMVPLLLWVAAVIVIFGVSFQMLQGLQGPLASLNAAAHVRYRFARVRMTANIYGFAETAEDMAAWRAKLKQELLIMREEYEALMYGGEIPQVAKGMRYDPIAPAAAFANEAFSNIFFKTQECLRVDKSGCFGPESEWHGVTHSGLDAMVVRYLDEMTVFANLPDNLAFPNHTSYEFVTEVAAKDMYDGLAAAAELFVGYTIGKFESVKQLHIILLVVSLVLFLLFVAKLFRPYVVRLHAESKSIAGMMSLLPAEVDIEALVKLHILGIRKENINSMRSASMDAGNASMPGAALFAPGSVAGAAMLQQQGRASLQMPGLLMPAAAGAAGGRFSAPGAGGRFGGGSVEGAAMAKGGRRHYAEEEEDGGDEDEE